MNKKLIISILVFVVVALVLTVSYFLVLKPYIQNVQNQALNYGVQYTVNAITQPLGECKTIMLPYGNNTSINVTAVECINKWK